MSLERNVCSFLMLRRFLCSPCNCRLSNVAYALPSIRKGPIYNNASSYSLPGSDMEGRLGLELVPRLQTGKNPCCGVIA